MGFGHSVGRELRSCCGVVCACPVGICRYEPLSHLNVPGFRAWLAPISDLVPIEMDLPVETGRVSRFGVGGVENWHKTIFPDPKSAGQIDNWFC